MADTKSWKIAAGLLIIGLVIGVVVGYASAPRPQATTGPTGPTVLTGQIPIGVLSSLTGPLSSMGFQLSSGVKMAASDVNNFLNASGQHFTLSILQEDDQSTPDGALVALQGLYAKGVQVVIGPSTTSQVANLKTYADSNHIVLMSPSSTGPSMAIPNDYILRFAPVDKYQMGAQARFLWDEGIRYIAIAQVVGQAPEEDTLFFRALWSQMGGNSSDPIKYDASAKDFSTEVSELNTLVQNGITQYGVAKVAVQFVGYEESAIWLNEAKDYPALMSVMWISNDGNAQSTVVLQEAGSLAAHVLFPCTLFGATNSAKYQEITSRLQAETGIFPSTYGLVAYDEVWIIAYALIMTQKYDGPTLLQYVPIVANSYYGASGWTALDVNGDRAFGDYDIWAIMTNATTGQPAWTKIASWSAATDSISWVHGKVGLPTNSTLPTG